MEELNDLFLENDYNDRNLLSVSSFVRYARADEYNDGYRDAGYNNFRDGCSRRHGYKIIRVM